MAAWLNSTQQPGNLCMGREAIQKKKTADNVIQELKKKKKLGT